MAVHDRHHLGPRAVDLAVDVALDEALALVAGERLAVGVELHQVGGGDQRRRARARHDEVVRALVAARADVAVGVEHAVLREDAAARRPGRRSAPCWRQILLHCMSQFPQVR